MSGAHAGKGLRQFDPVAARRRIAVGLELLLDAQRSQRARPPQQSPQGGNALLDMKEFAMADFVQKEGGLFPSRESPERRPYENPLERPDTARVRDALELGIEYDWNAPAGRELHTPPSTPGVMSMVVFPEPITTPKLVGPLKVKV